jgi:hypothetical protein
MKKKNIKNIITFLICIILGILLGSYFDNVLLVLGIAMFIAIALGLVDNK